jgi:hypothetical protein
MLTRRLLCRLLNLLGGIAVLLALAPDLRYQSGGTLNQARMEHVRANPSDMPYTNVIRLGWAGSPLFRYHSEKVLVESADGVTSRHTTEAAVGWLSWSALTLVVGVVLLGAARRLKPVQPADGHLPHARSDSVHP